jgi:hypothetical protein
MPRQRERQAQLEWNWTDTMRWEDVPGDARDELRTSLAAILRHAAQAGAEPADE